MGQESIPSSPGAIARLQNPEKLSEALARDNLDCWPCRITGALAFGGLGAYTYYSGHENLRLQQSKIAKSGTRFSMRSRHAAVTGTAAMFVGIGVWRLVN